MLTEQDLSLGWALIEAWYQLFPSPRDESGPFELTNEQALTVVDWYRVHPRSGQFVWRRGCSRRSKGSGKSPLEAAKCISELRLEVRFDHWAKKGEISPWGYRYQPGEPVGRPWGSKGDPAPWIQIASLSEDQDENTYTPLHTFLTANDKKLANELRIDAGLTRCILMDRSEAKIEPVTARAGSREGQPVTYATLDETGLMTRQNGGLKLARTIRRNTSKMDGRCYETTNGFVPGEDSVAEGTHKAITSGTTGIFYDAVEAPALIDGITVDLDAPDHILKAALSVPYKGCWWVDLNRIVADVRDPDNPWPDSERFFFNWNRKGEAKAIDPDLWAVLGDPTRTVGAKERIGVGFDGSINRDCTVLIGCTADGFLFPIQIWSRPVNAPGDWRVPRLEVERAVEEMFDRYDVGRMFCDPPKWQTEIERWMERWNAGKPKEDGVVVFFDTNQARRMSPACDRFETGVIEGSLSHGADAELTSHILAMVKAVPKSREKADDGRTLYVFTKPPDGRKIDAGIGAVLALQAAMTMPTATPKNNDIMVAWGNAF